ncbi:HAD family phosphatase [Akkermansiaceae bacterium]|nr:HAD family phosphatase [Akkermansiaceae bacterium]
MHLRDSLLSLSSDGFEGLIFDLDGTLVDSMPAHYKAWCEALDDQGAPGVFPEDVFYAMGGRPTRDIVEALNRAHGLSLDQCAVSKSKKGFFLKNLDQIELIGEVADIAQEYRDKVPLAIATGGGRVVVDKTLQKLGISSWFDAVVTASDVAHGKPSPDIFLEAARQIKVMPDRCVVFEDAEPGVVGARAAGMEVILIPDRLRIH